MSKCLEENISLKPCPLCEEEAEFERFGTLKVSCIVICKSCGCTVESNETDIQCGSQWNTRPADKVIENQDPTILWLCGYVMELHDFRDNLFSVNKDTNSLDAVMDCVVGKFPQLQGFSTQQQFRHFGKQVNIDEIQNNVSATMKRLRVKTKL